jgi:replication factor A1
MKSKRAARILRHKKSIGGYLAFLSVKYEVNSEKFLAALRQAGDEDKKANCDQFLIECRGKNKTNQIFLIKNALGIVAQFKASNDFLMENRKSLEEFMDAEMVRKHLSKKKRNSSYLIKDVRSGMKHVNLKAKVSAITQPRHIVTRFGNYANMAEVLIADETGTIKLCLWNEEIDFVSVGDTVQIVDARASTFRGERQLSLGIKGAFSSAEVCESKMEAPVLLPTCKGYRVEVPVYVGDLRFDSEMLGMRKYVQE